MAACLAASLAATSAAMAVPDSEPIGGAIVAPNIGETERLPAVPGLTAPDGATGSKASVLEPSREGSADRPANAIDRIDPGSDAVLTALAFIGVRYRRGGTTGAGFDCSGFTRHVFAQTLGYTLPRRVEEQAHAAGLVEVPRDALKPGDLVFFKTLKRTFSHVGIYIGDNRFVHAPKPGGGVRTEDLTRSYWKTRYIGARRVDAVAVAAPAAIDRVAAPLR